MVYTIKNVLISPGDSVRQFITEDRYRFVKPITFLFITALIYALVSTQFNVKTSNYDGPEGVISVIMNWLIGNPGYLNTIIVLFVAFWIKIFFKKAGYNFFEIVILLCFVFGITTLFDSVAIFFQGITHLNLIQTSMSIGVIYATWAIGQFFDKKRAASYTKAFLSYLLGVLTLGFLIAVAAIIETVIIL